MVKQNVKKMFSFSVAASMMLQGVLPVFAEEQKGVSMQGIYALYQTVKADCVGFEAGDAEFEWQYSSSVDGPYTAVSNTYSENPDEIWLVQGADEVKKAEKSLTPIQGEESVTKEAWVAYGTMENSLAGKWLKLKATVNGEVYESAARRVADTIGNWEYNISNSGENTLSVVNEKTPPENVFKVDGKEYILLDTTESPDKRFFVMSKNICADRVYYNNPSYNGQSFDELSYWLDNYLELPEKIASHIGENYWLYERPKWSHVSNMYQNAVLGKIAVPSQNEIKKYADKIGLQDDARDWWTRTPASGSSGDGNDMIYVCGSNDNLGKTSNAHAQNNVKGIRPIFYLDDSFFKDGQIPLSDMGTAVRKELFSRYTNEELLEFGYSVKEIDECRVGNISDLSIKGAAKANSTLSASYINEGASNKYITFSWIVSDTEDGTYAFVSEDKEYKIPIDMAEKWIKIVIGYADGKYVESEPVKIQSLWDDNFTGSIKSIELKGVYETFQNIKAEYEFDDITTEDDIVYKKWYISSSKTGTYQEISDEEILKTDTSHSGKYIKYGITLKNRRVFYSTPQMIGAAWNYHAKELTGADGSNPLHVINKTTPPEYTFKIGDSEFIMLDHFDSDSSAFLIMAKDIYGSRYFYNPEAGQSFDNMINWLNNDFYIAGNGGKTLPKQILGYIDMNQGWKVELKRYDSSVESGYYGGIAIPAVTDLVKYAAKIGLQDSNEDWWTRTPTSEAYVDGNYIQYVCGSEEELGQTKGRHGQAGSAGIRPMFYISKDYFLKYKLDPETTGIEVYHELSQKYTKNELRGLYDLKTLEEKFGYPGDYDFGVYDLGGIENSDGMIYMGALSSNGNKDVTLILGIYSSDNRLVYVNSKDVTLTEGVLCETLFTYENLGTDDGRHISAHILEKKDGKLIPVFYGKNQFDDI